MLMENADTFPAKFGNLGSVKVRSEAEIISLRKSAKFSAYSFASAPPTVHFLALYVFVLSLSSYI
jgi:hypothetical protein